MWGIVHVGHLAALDRGQQQWLIFKLGTGHLAGAFDGSQTSGPGVGLFTAPTYAVLHQFVDQHRAYDIASLTCLVPLALATVVVSRELGVAARSGRELLNVAAVMLGLPTLAAFVEAFHPADVLATAVVLVGLVAAARGRVGWTIVLLGFAVATRQWAVVPVAVVVVLVPRERRAPLVLGVMGVAAALILPFFLADPSATMSTLMARDVVSGQITAAALVPAENGMRFVLARYVPLLLAGIWCLWLLRRRATFSIELALAAVGAALLMRGIVDPAGYVYYLGPGYACCVLLEPTSRRWPIGGFVAGLVVWGRRALVDRYPLQGFVPHQRTFLPGSVLSSLVTVVIVVATVLAVRRARDLIGSSGGETGPRLPVGPSPEGAGHRRA